MAPKIACHDVGGFVCVASYCARLMNANEMNGMLQRECDSKADQVAAARQAHDTAENELREFTRKVAVDSSSLHQACRSTQHSLQRECQRQNQTIRQLEQQVSGEKSRCQMAIMDMEKYKVWALLGEFSLMVIIIGFPKLPGLRWLDRTITCVGWVHV